MVALRFENKEKDVYEADKYRALILIDLHKRKAHAVNLSKRLFISSLCFESPSSLIFAQRSGV